MYTNIRVVSIVLFAAVILAPVQPTARADVPGARIDLRVLVVTDGQHETEAFRQALQSVGVPTQVVDLRDPARQRIDAQFLADDAAPPRARFQAVVLPNPQPGLDAEELGRLREYEQRFGIRRLHASVPASPAVGLAEPGYIGQFDGGSAQLTEEALGGDFSYLRGRVPFRDETLGEPDSWIELASPLPGFRPLLTGEIPGVGVGALAGVFVQDGREELNLTFSYEAISLHFQVLAPGLIRWLTKGVHLGIDRSYLAVHIDDVLLPNARWLPEHKCASGDDCPAGVPPVPLIRMTPEDVAFAVEWQRAHGFRLDLAFNGSGSLAAGPTGTDPLTAALVAAKNEFGWINHTWSHLYLGCVRDETVRPWACAEIPLLGWKRYVPAGRIEQEIDKNVDFARRHGLPIDPTEVITGEHGGLRAPPQMEEDNPSLASALSASGVRTLATDASIERDQRPVGPAMTVPRHTINLYYFAATYRETADRFLWEHTTVADGGSGACAATASCIAPVPAESVFDQVILPEETAVVQTRVLTNDPRPHYAHQSQLTEDRTIYRLLEQVLGTYREVFSDARPLVVPTMSQSRDVLTHRARWNEALAAGRVTGWIEGGVVTVAVDTAMVPLTLPSGARAGAADGAEFGEPYGGVRSAWVQVEGEQRFTVREAGT